MPNTTPTVWNTNYFRTTRLRRAVPVGVTLLGCLGCAPAAKAEIRLASWRNGGQLSPASTDLKVEIDPAAGMAKIISTSVFANQSPADFEAEFLAQSPVNSIITQFSYWYKGQKTLARIVEKNRAIQIYSNATAPYQPHRRDPALVEMLSRHQFQVRIAPVEAKAPLKIEIVWWQPLEKEGSAWHLTLPWRTASLTESLAVKAHFSTPVQDLDSPFLDAKVTPQTLEFAEPDSNTPNGDNSPTITLTFKSKQRATLLQSRSGGEGYFVAIVPEAVWKNWAIWHLYHEVHSYPLGAGRRIVAGRYTKNSPAKTIGYQTQNNTEASEKWWASLELDDMQRHSWPYHSPEEAIAISKRYSLPCNWTCWLAIPDSERQKLTDIIDREKINEAYRTHDSLGRAMAQWKLYSTTDAAQYQSMLAQFNATTTLILRDKNSHPADLNSYFLDTAKNEISSISGVDVHLAQATRRAIFKLLAGVPQSDDLRKQTDDAVNFVIEREAGLQQVHDLTTEAIKALADGQPSADFEGKIRRVFPNNTGYYLFEDDIGQVAQEVVKTHHSSPQVSQQLENLLRALIEVNDAHTGNLPDVDTILLRAEDRVFGPHIIALRQLLAQEIVAHREGGARYTELRQELDSELAGHKIRFQSSEPDLRPTILATQIRLLQLRDAATLDSDAIAKTEAEIQRLSQFVSQGTFELTIKDTSGWYHWEGMSYLSSQWLLAVKNGGVGSPDALRIKNDLQQVLDAQYEASSDKRVKPLADDYLSEAEKNSLITSALPVTQQLAVERAKPRLDKAKIDALIEQLKTIQAASIYNKGTLTSVVESQSWQIYQLVIPALEAEAQKTAPDATTLAGLTDRLAEVAPDNDYIYRNFWRGSEQNELRGTPHDYAQLRVKRLTLRTQAHELATQLAKNPPVAKRRELRQEIAQWKQIDNQLRVRIGDPLIAIKAPQNARQVLAIFPNGELRQLTWNVQTAQWEVRFDVPAWASEGDYTVQIVVLFASGKRQHLTMHFTVDLQSPNGLGSLLHEGNNWQLKLETDALTDRVSAFLPWNERVELQRSEGNTFTAGVTAPEQFQQENAIVRFVLTDKAHNRTEVAIDWK